MQGLAGVPKPPLTSEEQLPPAQELPKRAPRPEYATSAIGKETDKASVATTRIFADPGKYWPSKVLRSWPVWRRIYC